MSATKRSIVWFRRDLRISDNPALLAAIESADEIIPVFILDPTLIGTSGSKRLAYLGQSLRALDESLHNSLHVMVGNQVDVLKELMARYGATSVHISAEFEPYGAAQDLRVEDAGIPLIRTGSPYAVAPGRVVKPSDGTPYKVYTPFYRAWCLHGWRKSAPSPKTINAVTPTEADRNFPDWPLPDGVSITAAGEKAALERWRYFQKNGLDNYDETRNLAGIDGTSKLSAHLTWGVITTWG
jgi:deoxyribodipyrimidine photo-lyase